MSNPGFHSTWTAIQFIVLLSVCRRLTGTLTCIRQFSEAGLREWIPFVIFRARSRERSQLPFPGLFLSRRCFTLCIIMEIETRIAKHYKCHYRCVCKDYRGKLMEEGEGGGVCIVSWLTRRSWVRRKTECVFWQPIARATSSIPRTTSSCRFMPDTLWLRAFKNAFKVGTVTLRIHSHRPPLWRKYAPEVKTAKGLKRCQVKSQGS